MARIRSVKPELRTSLTVAAWPREVRYAWVLLWGYLDDYGRGKDDLRLMLADMFPLDRDVTERKLDRWLGLMCQSGPDDDVPPLCRYEVDGRRYLHAVKWRDRQGQWRGHQKISHPTDSRIPPCPVHEGSGTAPEGRANGSGEIPESFRPSRAPAEQGAGSKGAGSKGAGSSNAPAGDPPPLDAEQLDLGRRAVAAVVPVEHPTKVRQQLAAQAAELLANGTDGGDVTAGLYRWLAHPSAGPRLLPSLVSDVIRERSGAGQRRTLQDKASEWLAIGDQLAADPPPLRALPGGQP